MTNVIVNVRRDGDPQQHDLEVPSDLEIAALVEGIMHALNWETDSYGLPIRYQIWADPPGRVLAWHETLGEVGTWDGARLVFQPLAAWVVPMSHPAAGTTPAGSPKMPPPAKPTGGPQGPRPLPAGLPSGATPAPVGPPTGGSGGPAFGPPPVVTPPPTYNLPPRLIANGPQPIRPQATAPPPGPPPPPETSLAGPASPTATSPGPSPLRGWKKLDGIPPADEADPPPHGFLWKELK
ncbi:MAG: hypothetical protein M3Z04_21895 [Chloroflexota bacterium]|nr:hypothetical protein [Chloroflexota bacterium]